MIGTFGAGFSSGKSVAALVAPVGADAAARRDAEANSPANITTPAVRDHSRKEEKRTIQNRGLVSRFLGSKPREAARKAVHDFVKGRTDIVTRLPPTYK